MRSMGGLQGRVSMNTPMIFKKEPTLSFTLQSGTTITRTIQNNPVLVSGLVSHTGLEFYYVIDYSPTQER